VPLVTSVCVHACMYVCTVHAVTFQSPDLKTLTLLCSTASEYVDHFNVSRSSWYSRGHRTKRSMCVCHVGLL